MLRRLLLCRVEGAGLQTGDASLNIDAPVVVMTTEILRNMLYRADGPEDEAGGSGRSGASQDRLKVSELAAGGGAWEWCRCVAGCGQQVGVVWCCGWHELLACLAGLPRSARTQPCLHSIINTAA